MGSPSIGSVVILSFPFSDLSQSKLRPAVVLADAQRSDWVLCQITSKAYSDSAAIKIENSDFETGSLSLVSYARPGKLFTANSSLIVSYAGVLNKAATTQIIESVIAFLCQSLPDRKIADND